MPSDKSDTALDRIPREFYPLLGGIPCGLLAMLLVAVFLPDLPVVGAGIAIASTGVGLLVGGMFSRRAAR